MKREWTKTEELLKNGGVAVIPTDTLYGLVGSVFSEKAVEKIYKLKNRDKTKALIVLISSYKDLETFGINIEENQAKILKEFWPGKVSVILPCKSDKWKHIHKGLGSIAFRMIGSNNENLLELIADIGPIVAPSANKEGLPPSLSISEAKKYFSSEVDIYIDEGFRGSKPSTLVTFKKNKPEVLRQGEVMLGL